MNNPTDTHAMIKGRRTTVTAAARHHAAKGHNFRDFKDSVIGSTIGTLRTTWARVRVRELGMDKLPSGASCSIDSMSMFARRYYDMIAFSEDRTRNDIVMDILEQIAKDDLYLAVMDKEASHEPD